MKKLAVGIILLGLLVAPMAAHADSYDLTLVTVNPYVAQTVVYNNIRQTWLTGYYVINVEGIGIVNSFCIDPASISMGTTYVDGYNVLTIPEADIRYKEVAYILDNSTTSNAVASQLAVWEIMFDSTADNSLTNTTGNFYVVSTGYTADAQAIVTNVSKLASEGQLNDYDVSQFKIAVSPAGKTITYATGTQDYEFKVPEPGTVLLLGMGLLGVGWLRRKSSR